MDVKEHITQAEWPIMQVLWNKESATASEIVEIVTADKSLSMRTVKTLIRRLVARGSVGYRVDERNSRLYHYFPLVTKESCTVEKATALLDMVSDADMGDLLVRFIGEARLSQEQIKTLQELLKKKHEEPGS